MENTQNKNINYILGIITNNLKKCNYKKITYYDKN